MATVQASPVAGRRGASAGPNKNRFLLGALISLVLAGTIVGLTARYGSVGHEQKTHNEPAYLFGRNLRGLSPLPATEPVYMHGRNLQGLSRLEPAYLFGRNLRGLSPLPAEEPVYLPVYLFGRNLQGLSPLPGQ